MQALPTDLNARIVSLGGRIYRGPSLGALIWGTYKDEPLSSFQCYFH